MCYRGIATLTFVMFSFGGWAAAKEPDAPDTDPDIKAITTVDPDIPIDQLQVIVKPLTKSELLVEADAWFELLRNKARQIAAARLGVKKVNEAITADGEEAVKESLNEAKAVRENANEIAEETEKELTESAQKELGVKDAADDDAVKEEKPPADSTAASERSATDGNDAEADSSSDAESVEDKAATVKDEMLADVTVLQDERTALSDRLEVVLHSLENKGGDVKEYRQYAAAVSGVELDTSDAGSAWAGIVGWITSKEGGQRWAWNLGQFVLILIVSYFGARLIAATVNWVLERKVKLTQLAERLISSTITNVLMLVGFAIALTALEIDITPIVAAIGATGLVVGLALQGTLSNFASGLMILINRPFDVGNTVTAGGITGTVHQMNLVSTTFRTFDNQTIHVPNNEIWNNVITNITANDTRRVDLVFGIGYSDDIGQAQQVLEETVANHPLVLDQPQPVIRLHELADSSVNFICRPWVKQEDYWSVYWDLTRQVKEEFDAQGISIPFPQRDIHVFQESVPSGNGSRQEQPV